MSKGTNLQKKSHGIGTYLRIESAGGAIWSPGTKRRHSGREIAFIYNGSGNYQIYKTLSRYPGSWPQRLTYTDERTTAPMYSPDGSILYTQDKGGNEKWQIYLLKSQSGSDPIRLTDNVESINHLSHIDEYGYYFSSNKRDPKIFDIYYGKFSDIETENKNELILKNIGINIISVIDCFYDRWLLIKEQASNFESSFHIYDMDKKELIPITAVFSKGKDARWEDGWFLDDTYLLVVSDFGRDFLSLGLINWREPLEGVRWLEPDQYDTEHVDVHVGTKRVVYTKNKDGYSKLYQGYLNKKNHFMVKEIPVPEGAVIAGGDRRSFFKPITWNPAGDRLAVTMSTPRVPMNVWMYELREYSFGYWKITQADGSGIPSKNYIKPELIKYISLHNIKIPFFLYLPKGTPPNEGWPALIMIHGGPESQIRPAFNDIIQYFVASGLAVITPNVRGSTGYGRRYSSLDDLEKRPDSVADIKYLVDFLKEENRINSNKLAVYGGSYGGYMVLASITEYPKLFKAAIDVVGISNFISFLENTAKWRRHLREREYGSLTKDKELLQRISPINKVQNIITPTLVIHGENDQRVPVNEAIQIYNELNARDIPSQLLRFSDEGHGIVKLKNKLQLYPQILGFLKRYLDL